MWPNKFPETPEEALEILRNQPLSMIVGDMLMGQRQMALVLNALKQAATPGSQLAGQVDDLERATLAMFRNQMEPMVEYALSDKNRKVKDA